MFPSLHHPTTSSPYHIITPYPTTLPPHHPITLLPPWYPSTPGLHYPCTPAPHCPRTLLPQNPTFPIPHHPSTPALHHPNCNCSVLYVNNPDALPTTLRVLKLAALGDCDLCNIPWGWLILQFDLIFFPLEHLFMLSTMSFQMSDRYLRPWPALSFCFGRNQTERKVKERA